MKRNSRTENFQWTFEGISAAREFRGNIELLIAGEEERQTRLAYGRDNANGIEESRFLKEGKTTPKQMGNDK